MELKIVKAYIAALFELAKNGNVFATEANAMIRDIASPGVNVADMFAPIENAPANSFESALKLTAERIARN